MTTSPPLSSLEEVEEAYQERMCQLSCCSGAARRWDMFRIIAMEFSNQNSLMLLLTRTIATH